MAIDGIGEGFVRRIRNDSLKAMTVTKNVFDIVITVHSLTSDMH